MTRQSRQTGATSPPTQQAITSTPSVAPPPAAVPQRKPSAWPAVVTGLLFVGWIGYLLYLVLDLQHGPGGAPVVLSRPQFLVSELDVVAHLDDDSGKAVIEKVLSSKLAENSELVGTTIFLTNLSDCKPFAREPQKDSDVPADFTGPGSYILPLRSAPQAAAGRSPSYEVVPTPPSPGYTGYRKNRAGPARIYPANKETLAQYHRIPKPE
jgi:hypothetical protein